MYTTAEVRWFFEGQVPEDVLDWYKNLPGEATLQPKRVDHYLKIASIDSLGIKIREGRIEIKQSTHQVGEVTFHPHISGRVGNWRKWSFDLASGIPFIDLIQNGTQSWIPVEKTRQLRRYAVLENLQVTPVSPFEPYPNGCELELTKIRMGSDSWWTVGFEAFGLLESLYNSLESTVDFVLNSPSPPHLELNNSYSYPHWLLRNCFANS